MLINLVPKDAAERVQPRFASIVSRLQAAEGIGGGGD